MPGENKMTKDDASRIQSGAAKSGGDTSKDSFPARAQSAADKNSNASGHQNNGSGQQNNGGQGGGAKKSSS